MGPFDASKAEDPAAVLRQFPRFRHARPITCVVEEGEVLYLPAMWFHHVRQSRGTIAVNYWYDMAFDARFVYFQLCERLGAVDDAMRDLQRHGQQTLQQGPEPSRAGSGSGGQEERGERKCHSENNVEQGGQGDGDGDTFHQLLSEYVENYGGTSSTDGGVGGGDGGDGGDGVSGDGVEELLAQWATTDEVCTWLALMWKVAKESDATMDIFKVCGVIHSRRLDGEALFEMYARCSGGGGSGNGGENGDENGVDGENGAAGSVGTEDGGRVKGLFGSTLRVLGVPAAVATLIDSTIDRAHATTRGTEKTGVWGPNKEGETIVSHAKYSSVYEGCTPTIYDQWAKDGYDQDVGAVSIATTAVSSKLLPLLEAEAAKDTSKRTFKVIDAGCGTGSVAERCVEAVKQLAGIEVEFDGMDFSQGMLDVARTKNCYGRLEQADLQQKLTAFADDTYDAMTCCGVFLQGHVGAEAIPELARILKPGGLMVFSVRPTFFEETEAQWLEALRSCGCDVLSTDMLPYAKGMKAPFLSCRKRAR